jgi:thioredoxin reductase (NADPH)
MAKPTILTVDDDLDVLQAISRDLRKQYGDRFRIVRANSGASAIEALEQLKIRNETVALFLTDQRMPGMSGVEFIEQAAPMFPQAKRVLLTAYADTNAAIQAINTARLDYYLLKPWDPPAEKLYPVLDDLLEDWLAVYRPAFKGIRVIGDRWSSCSHNVKDFLARNQIPYQWLDIETEPEAAELLEYASNGSKLKLPLVLFTNGDRLEQPSSLEIATKIGLQTQAEKPFYDLVIVCLLYTSDAADEEL